MAYPKAFVQVSGMENSIFPIAGACEVFEKSKQLYADGSWPHVRKLLGR